MKTGYYGYVIDNLDTLPERKTKVYQTYEEAHKAAEKLCVRTYGERASIEVYFETN